MSNDAENAMDEREHELLERIRELEAELGKERDRTRVVICYYCGERFEYIGTGEGKDAAYRYMQEHAANCSCDPQKARAEKAEAELARARALLLRWHDACKPNFNSEVCEISFEEGEALGADTLAALEGKPASCTWTENDDGAWETDCGETFEFTDGGPAENGAKFCQYCGKAIKVEARPYLNEVAYPQVKDIPLGGKP